MESTVEYVIGINADLTVKYLYPNSQHHIHQIGYELRINNYLKTVKVKEIACGSKHVLMLTIDGKLIA